MNRLEPPAEIISEIHRALNGLSEKAFYRLSQPSQLTWLLSSCLMTQRVKENPQERMHLALRSVFNDILTTLEREDPEHAQLLRWRYWGGSSVKEIVLNRLSSRVSERQFYRMQKRALELFVLMFWEMEEACNRASYQGDQADGKISIDHNHPTLSLSRREIMILDLLSKGLTPREIGAQLGYSTKYVENSLAEVRHKVGARNTTHAVALALRHGLIPLDR